MVILGLIMNLAFHQSFAARALCPRDFAEFSTQQQLSTAGSRIGAQWTDGVPANARPSAGAAGADGSRSHGGADVVWPAGVNIIALHSLQNA